MSLGNSNMCMEFPQLHNRAGMNRETWVQPVARFSSRRFPMYRIRIQKQIQTFSMCEILLAVTFWRPQAWNSRALTHFLGFSSSCWLGFLRSACSLKASCRGIESSVHSPSTPLSPGISTPCAPSLILTYILYLITPHLCWHADKQRVFPSKKELHIQERPVVQLQSTVSPSNFQYLVPDLGVKHGGQTPIFGLVWAWVWLGNFCMTLQRR